MSLKDKTIVVTGGSRGLGLGLVEALSDQGAKVIVVARDEAALASAQQRLGVAVTQADVTEEGAAHRILAEVRPEILVLNAGAAPRMGRLDQLSWADFTLPWEIDVKARGRRPRSRRRELEGNKDFEGVIPCGRRRRGCDADEFARLDVVGCGPGDGLELPVIL